MGYAKEVWNNQGSVSTQDTEFNKFSVKECEGTDAAGHTKELWDGVGAATKPTDGLVSPSLTFAFSLLSPFPNTTP